MPTESSRHLGPVHTALTSDPSAEPDPEALLSALSFDQVRSPHLHTMLRDYMMVTMWTRRLEEEEAVEE